MDMRIPDTKMYLYRSRNRLTIELRIERVLLMNSITWPMRALSAREVVVKALNKDKNDILNARLSHISKSHSKQIGQIVGNIDGDLSKMYFCETWI